MEQYLQQLTAWRRHLHQHPELSFEEVEPSRFIAEMALDAAATREDPREKLKALRAEFAQKAARQQQAQERPSAHGLPVTGAAQRLS